MGLTELDSFDPVVDGCGNRYPLPVQELGIEAPNRLQQRSRAGGYGLHDLRPALAHPDRNSSALTGDRGCST
ncbi:MAG TPA: hypothetical protein VFS64_10105 [Solirubrobacterales bacterium]|nr:hypothetical protein [Solirubrobacterales bacterium]